MSELLIFGGTTEGRLLAEFCAANQIETDVSAATEYGAQLLPESVGTIIGKKNSDAIFGLLQSHPYKLVIDATHPFAEEATHNIRIASQKAGIPYLRLLRQQNAVCGEAIQHLSEMVALLNQTDAPILSTLGSKSLPALTKINNYPERLWLRLLPSDTIRETCITLGFQPDHLILEKGPFNVEQNITHIMQSKAQILITKDSGAIGGYPEKAEAARQCGIRMITLQRPQESGFTLEQISAQLLQHKEEGLL